MSTLQRTVKVVEGFDAFAQTLFLGLGTFGAIALLQGHFYPWTRVNLFIGSPHAYKVILWSAVFLFGLRKRYHWRALLALMFFYPLNETIGNSLYFLIHIQRIPYALWITAGNWAVLLSYPAYTLLTFLLMRQTGEPVQIKPKWFLPFALVQIGWLLIGFHVQFDVCCNQLLTGDPLTESLDAIWTASWMLGVYASSR